MKLNKPLAEIGLVVLVLLLLFTVSTVTTRVVGQGPEDDINGSEVEDGSEGPEIALSQPPYTMNYQGYLTGSSGDPLDGSYDMVFRLYDDALAGSMEWGPETHLAVQVSDGLFQVALGTSVELQPNDFDEALFLAVQVNGTDVTPRQPLRAVPYAFGLLPGAEVDGEPSSGNYGLRVENTGSGSADRGLYVKGEQYGIYAEEVGDDSDVGIYSPDFVHAKGFRSNSDSYLWVPGTASVLYPSSGCTLYNQSHGSVRLECSSSGSKYIDVPIAVPAVLYGQEVRVESIRVYYDLDHTGSFIGQSRLRKLTRAGGSDELINDMTDHKSTAPTSYGLSPTANYTLTASAGALNLNLTIEHDGDLAHDVNLGGVRVRLRHFDEP